MAVKTLKKLRENKRMTQKEVSNEIGVTKEYIGMLENGKRNPSDSMKKKLAELYECNVTDIFLACEETKCFK